MGQKKVPINLESCAWAHLKENHQCHTMKRSHRDILAKSGGATNVMYILIAMFIFTQSSSIYICHICAYLDGILLGFCSHRVPASMDLGHVMGETKSAIAEFAFLAQHVNVRFATFQVTHVVHFVSQTQ